MADDVNLRFKLTGDDAGASKAVDGVGDSVDKVEDKFKNLKTGAAAGAAAAGLAAGAALGKAFLDNMNIEAANDKLAGQLGLTSAEAEMAGAAAGNVYRQNWGESIEDVNAAIASVGTTMADVRNTTQADLESMTSKALALASTFDVDVNRSTGAAAALMKNGLAKDSTEAFDILTAGFQNGVNKADDFTETLTEYSPQFAKLGISGSQALGILMDGLKGGARDTDVIADAFKEFSLRSIDGSKLTAEGFKAAGLDANLMAAEIAKGGEAANGATQQTLQGLLSIKDPQEQNTAGVALFGTQWEDTVRQILPSIVSMGDASDLTQGATQAMMDTVGDNNRGKIDTMKRSIEGWTQSMAESDSSMGLVVTGMATFGGGALAAAGDLGMLVAGIGASNIAKAAAATWSGIATAAQWLWNAALAANPIGLVIIAIAALVAGLVWFFTKTETGRAIWTAAMAAMSSAVTTFKNGASTAITWVTTKWDSLVSTLQSAPGKVRGGLSSMFNGMRDGFRAAINFIVRGWNNLRFGIPGFSYAGISVAGFSVGVPQIPYLADGGIVTRPTLAVIGEAGPEAVVPLSRGMSDLGVPGGGGITVNVTGVIGDPDFLARQIKDVLNRSAARGYGY